MVPFSGHSLHNTTGIYWIFSICFGIHISSCSADDIQSAVMYKFNIPLDEYPRRCINQIARWKTQKEELMAGGNVSHNRTTEYASYIMEAIVTGSPYMIGGNVLNGGCIENLPPEACVEVKCLVDNGGIHPTHVGSLPLQLAAMNMTNVNVQLLTVAAAKEKSMEHVYHAAMLDPHTGSQLSTDEIISLCDELKAAHEAAGHPIF